MATIKADALRHAALIRKGYLLAIDPASGATSKPGWAAWRAGKLLNSGTLDIPPKYPIQQRLRILYETLLEAEPDVLVIERIRGPKAHEFLRWAVGISVTATCPQVFLEMPVSTWKKHAGPKHVKSDETDALAIGHCLLHLAGVKAA